MYRKILAKYKEALPSFPTMRRPRVGAVIREMRVNQGITQAAMAKEIGINKATISAFENDHQKATSIENLEKYTKRLGGSVEDLILLGREYDPCNAFVLKKHDPEQATDRYEMIDNIEGLPERKYQTKDWFGSLRIRMTDFDVIPISPPINFRKDFFIARFVLPPKRQIRNLSTGLNCSVVGIISAGFDLHMDYAGQSFDLGGILSFQINGLYPHSIINDNDNQTAIFYLVTKIPFKEPLNKHALPHSSEASKVNIASAVDFIRIHASQYPDSPLPLRRLASLTDTLNEKQIQEILRLKKDSSVVYWEKIEDLLGATDTSFEDFLSWGKGKNRLTFSTSSTINQALISYGQYGVEIKTRNPPLLEKDFFCGYLDLAGVAPSNEKEGMTKQEKKHFLDWHRNDNTMTAYFVEYGAVRLVIGKRKRVFYLTEGDSAYIDTSQGCSIKNLHHEDSRLFFATSPSFQI